ncbi:unnamed protein product [Cunninghamella blakesleeana]
MLLKLPLELRLNVFSYLHAGDLVNLSYTCKSLRQAALNIYWCEECHGTKKIAICREDKCNEMVCKYCFQDHSFKHLIKFVPVNLDFTFDVEVSTKKNRFTYKVVGAHEIFHTLRKKYLSDINNNNNNNVHYLDESDNNNVHDSDYEVDSILVRKFIDDPDSLYSYYIGGYNILNSHDNDMMMMMMKK